MKCFDHMSFTDTKVYSALGNHDYHPKSQLPPGPNSIYDKIAEMWRGWLEADSKETFKNGDSCTFVLQRSVCNVNTCTVHSKKAVKYTVCIFSIRWLLHRKTPEPSRLQSVGPQHQPLLLSEQGDHE